MLSHPDWVAGHQTAADGAKTAAFDQAFRQNVVDKG